MCCFVLVVFLSIWLICDCISNCAESKYKKRDCCSDCPYRDECEGCDRDDR